MKNGKAAMKSKNQKNDKAATKSEKLEQIYYSTGGYWKGLDAIPKLSDVAGVDEDVARLWLEKQVLWQIYLSPPRHIPRPHWTIDVPNFINQADLLFLPHDTIGRKTYKYALIFIDIASRYKDAEPLTSKLSSEVESAFKKIYSRKLKWPNTLMVDPGREFMGNVSVLMEKNGVKIQRSEAGNHIAQAFVERANKTLGEKIFSDQQSQELISAGRNREWVKRLPGLIKTMNSSVTRLTGKEPTDAIDLKEINSIHSDYNRVVGFDEKRLPGFVKVRYLLAPGENEGGGARRATDPFWSLKMFDLKRSVVVADQPVLNYLENGPKHGFVREELQVVPEDSELPPTNSSH